MLTATLELLMTLDPRPVILATVFVLAACSSESGPEASDRTSEGPASSDTASDGTTPVGDTATPSDETGMSAVCAARTVDDEVTLDGVSHSFRVYVPQGIEGPAPVVVQLHGLAGSGSEMDEITGFSALANAEGFVVVSPDGWESLGGLRGWDAGTCCTFGFGAPDHVAAFAAILDEVVKDTACVDPSRVYFAGQSNGGMMSYRLACELSDRVTAIAVHGAYMADGDPPEFDCDLTRSVPLLHAHGLEDGCVLYEGSANNPAVEDIVADWRERNGCDAAGTDKTDGFVRRRAWTCAEGSTVELITTSDHGHKWSGAIPDNAASCAGPNTDRISMTEEAWRFFSAH